MGMFPQSIGMDDYWKQQQQGAYQHALQNAYGQIKPSLQDAWWAAWRDAQEKAQTGQSYRAVPYPTGGDPLAYGMAANWSKREQCETKTEHDEFIWLRKRVKEILWYANN